jgi:hypothetical protein
MSLLHIVSWYDRLIRYELIDVNVPIDLLICTARYDRATTSRPVRGDLAFWLYMQCHSLAFPAERYLSLTWSTAAGLSLRVP